MTDERTEYEVVERDRGPPPLPRRRKKSPARWLLPGLLLSAVIVGVVVWIVVAGGGDDAEGPVPLITAEEGPDKIAPEDPGGMDVPDQDKTVYDAMTGEEAAEEPEHLLPPAEEPAPEGPVAEALEAEPIDNMVGSPAESAAATDSALDAPMEQPAGEAVPVPPAETMPEAERAAPEPTPEPATPAVEPALAVASAPGGDYLVQIGSFRSAETAAQEGVRLSALHNDLLGALEVSVQRADLGADKGVYYRTRVGAFASRTQADTLCDALKDRKQDCLVVKQ